MAQQLAMVVDSAKCFDCKGCVVSCKVANDVPAGFTRNWIKEQMPDTPAAYAGGVGVKGHFQPGGCMHCSEPTCVWACPTGATFRNEETGEVVIDKDLCIGCGNCIPACPYGARYRHPETRKADKCNFCVERRALGLQPACVDTCPTKARVFGDINDPDSEAGKLFRKNKASLVQVVNAKTNTKPNMYYLDATAPGDWPHMAQAPVSMGVMKSVADPVVKIVTALSGLGVLAMLGRQLFVGSSEEHTETEEQ